jgi:hypothetical protein
LRLKRKSVFDKGIEKMAKTTGMQNSSKHNLAIGYTFHKSEIEIMAGVYGKGGIDDKTFSEIQDRLEGGFVEVIWDAVKEEVRNFFNERK